MATSRYKYICLLFVSTIYPILIYCQYEKNACISGKLFIDDTWDSIIYLSHIPTFDDMYVMSNEIIIAKTSVDSLGYFKFDINFLPIDDNLFRIHITKRGDSPATLIIGGKDENHLFLIANRYSNFQFTAGSSYPPFKNTAFKNSRENIALEQVSKLVFQAESTAAESSASKRRLIENKLQKDLLLIADTSNSFLVSLYAIYKSKFESNYASNLEFYNSYIKKWKNQNNTYYKSFKKQLPIKTMNSSVVILGIILAFILVIIGFFIGKFELKKNKDFEKLSIQERKIFELLRHGATNQEISNQCNIEISTVKSHVSSIYTKLNIKSRKEIMNIK